jgi:predicted component of type VI protein secretion system
MRSRRTLPAVRRAMEERELPVDFEEACLEGLGEMLRAIVEGLAASLRLMARLGGIASSIRFLRCTSNRQGNNFFGRCR